MPLDKHEETWKEIILLLKQNWNPRDERRNPDYWPGRRQNLTSLATSSTKAFHSKFRTTEVSSILHTTLLQSLSPVNTCKLLSNLLKKKKKTYWTWYLSEKTSSVQKKRLKFFLHCSFRQSGFMGVLPRTLACMRKALMCANCVSTLRFTCSQTAQTNRRVKQKGIYRSAPWLQHHRDLWSKNRTRCPRSAADATMGYSPYSRWESSGSCGRVFLSPLAALLQQLPAKEKQNKLKNASKLQSSRDSFVYIRMFLKSLIAL